MHRPKTPESLHDARIYQQELLAHIQEYTHPLTGVLSPNSQSRKVFHLNLLHKILTHIKENAPRSLGKGVCYQVEHTMSELFEGLSGKAADDNRLHADIVCEGIKSKAFKRVDEGSSVRGFPIHDKDDIIFLTSVQQFHGRDLSYGRQAELRLIYLDILIEELNSIGKTMSENIY